MWVWIFGGIAALGLIMVVGYGIWLWHKLQDLWSEIEMVGRRGEELAALIDQIQLPDSSTAAETDDTHVAYTSADDPDDPRL